MADAYTPYETGLKHLLERIDSSHPRFTDLLVFQQRLSENITQTRRHGDTENRRAERSQVIDNLNQLAFTEVGFDFNALCVSDTTQFTLHDDNFNVIEDSSLVALITNPDISDPILLLGAGASQKSGVPLNGELVELAAKWAYCRSHHRVPDDPTIRRSDWLPWLQDLSWYNPQQPLENQYTHAIPRLLPSIEERRAFFREFSRRQVSASSGYQNLVRLMADRRIRTIFTTNFDTVLLDHSDKVPNPRRVRSVCSPDDYRFLSTDPLHPQLIYLYGDGERYADYYFDNGYERLDTDLVESLIPLMRDHPVIVIGYSGRERSIMQHLLAEQTTRTYRFHHGLYWCVLRSYYPHRVHPSVIELAQIIGSNFKFALIDSFDELMANLFQTTHELSPRLRPVALEEPEDPITYDMQLAPDLTLADLDWAEVQTRLLAYCRTMNVSVPAHVTDEWLLELLQAQDLARLDNNVIRPTIAGSLLFSKNPIPQLSGSRIEVHVTGEEPAIFAGNLWRQLQVVNLLESEFNTPFRLKGSKSEMVTPYPYLALKEVVVNALAHRRYEGEPDEPVIIQVEPAHITIVSPGGLYETVRQQLPDNVPPEETLGKQPVKGYRNPVIADFLYSSGEMDKKGSGLVHLRDWMRQNGGGIRFRLGPDNVFFEVTLYCRPEKPEITTGTATPLIPAGEFISNVLEVVELSNIIWSDETTYRWVPEIKRQTQEFLPAFVLYDGRLYTFSDLSLANNPLRSFTLGTDIQPISRHDFSLRGAGERRVVNLFNEALSNYIKQKGLIFEWKRKLAYFPRQDDGERTITYQARLRKATRTVVKPRISATINKVSHWDHQAVEFQFKKFGDTWGLQLLPTYMFTFDGYSDRLPGERIGPLVTRRLAREYNVHVDSHLIFWTTILSEEQPEIILEDTLGSRIRLRGTLVSFTLHTLEAQPEEEEPPMSNEDIDELEEQLSEFVDEDEDEEMSA